MSFLPPSEYRVWKQALRNGQVDLATARTVGGVLARVHGFSAARPELAEQFATDAIFFDIRLEPYLLATAQRHPDLAPILERLVQVTRAHTLALVHGDVSPKNILIGARGPVLLDAECAWWGDPAFDIAFCLNHLLLKCLWNTSATSAFLSAFETLSETYLQAVNWEPRLELERRAAALLPGLFLARVDGKSPVEYVTAETQRDRVRRVAGALLRQPVQTLRSVCAAWREEMSH
jgi:aminoglycoside phosphotransferase (APT) family kinase protein